MNENVIVDAHAHIFSSVDGLIRAGNVRGLDYGRVQIGDDDPFQLFPPYQRETSFTPETLIANMDWAGVAKAVLLQGSFYGERNQEVVSACREHPERFVGAAYLDPWVDDPQSEFDRLFRDVGFRILKLELSDRTGLHGLHPGFQLDDECLHWLWNGLRRHDAVLTVDLGPVGGPPYQTHAVHRIATDWTDLKIVICHLAFPTRKMDRDQRLLELWKEQIQLAKLSNVWFDLAALPHRAEESYPYPKMAEWVRYAGETVGYEKLMWGTDAPGVTSAGTYPQLLLAFEEFMKGVSTAEQAAVFGATALAVYPFAFT